MNLDVKNGIIEKAKIFGDFFSEKGISEVEEALVQTQHEEMEIRKALSGLPIEKHFRNIGIEELIAALF
jgi:lipoate-protein ligase A